MDALSSDMQRLQAKLGAAQAGAVAEKQHAEELQKKLARERAASVSHPLPPQEVGPILLLWCCQDIWASSAGLQCKCPMITSQALRLQAQN